MRHFSASPEAQMYGFYANAFVDNLQSEEVRPIMEKHHLVDLDPAQLYPCQWWMDALNEIASRPNLSPNFVAIGMKIAQIIPIPNGLTQPTFEQMMME